jgi:hypothetical protein
MLALHHFGHHAQLDLLPDPAGPDLLATVRLGTAAPAPTASVDELFAVTTARHCNRRPYRTGPLLAATVDRLRQAAAVEGAWLAALTDRPAIAAAAAATWHSRRPLSEVLTTPA